jgi:molybdate transport system permease protein
MQTNKPPDITKQIRSRINFFFSFNFFSTTSSLIFFLLFILPGFSLIWRAITNSNPGQPTNFDYIVTPLSLSLVTTACSILIIFIFGTPLAYNLARMKNPIKRFITVFIELPIVMPPVVAGLALLSTFGRRGLLGAPLDIFGLQLTFTPIAVIIAQIFVGAPFYIRAAQNRFSSIPSELEESARIDGASDWCIFRTIMIPLSYRAIISGLILSWARGLGEFGATILFAGNLQGKTQTLPLFIYSSLENDLGATFMSASLMLVISLCLFGLTRIFTKLDDDEVLASNY